MATALLDPAVIVHGGGLASAGDALLGPVEKALGAAALAGRAVEVRP
jgi:predicted NBD/HSP70 family sugar kinase